MSSSNVQKSAKELVRIGCGKFVPALACLLCLDLPGSCLARFANFFADLCTCVIWNYDMRCHIRSRFELDEVDDFGDFWLAPSDDDGVEGLFGRWDLPVFSSSVSFSGEGLFRCSTEACPSTSSNEPESSLDGVEDVDVSEAVFVATAPWQSSLLSELLLRDESLVLCPFAWPFKSPWK